MTTTQTTTTSPHITFELHKLSPPHAELVTTLRRMLESINAPTDKRCIYIYGEPGIGKTVCITNILFELGYNVIAYDAGDCRNSDVIATMSNQITSDKRVICRQANLGCASQSSICRDATKQMKNIILMDELDGLNINGDKGGFSALTKLIRPKKAEAKTKKSSAKKSAAAPATITPIVCISNCKMDKKMSDLAKLCHVLPFPSVSDVARWNIIDAMFCGVGVALQQDIAQYAGRDLRKLFNLGELRGVSTSEEFAAIFSTLRTKMNDADPKKIVENVFSGKYSPYTIHMHDAAIDECHRTSVGLMWHENLPDHLFSVTAHTTTPGDTLSIYVDQLQGICDMDKIDKLTYQYQIWQFNEMSSLVKTFRNARELHKRCGGGDTSAASVVVASPPRFTKILTKCVTEHKNAHFILDMCQKFGMDEKDLFAFFIQLYAPSATTANLPHELPTTVSRIKYISADVFANTNITKPEVIRLNKYINTFLPGAAVAASATSSVGAGITDDFAEQDMYDLRDYDLCDTDIYFRDCDY